MNLRDTISLRDLHRLATGDWQPPQPMLVIRERQPIAIGRPTRRIEIAALEVSQDLLRAAFGRTDRNLLLAGHSVV